MGGFFGKWKKDDVDRGVQPNYYSETGDDTMYSPYAFRENGMIKTTDLTSGYMNEKIPKYYYKEDWWTLVDEGNKCERGCWGNEYFDGGGGGITMVTLSIYLLNAKASRFLLWRDYHRFGRQHFDVRKKNSTDQGCSNFICPVGNRVNTDQGGKLCIKCPRSQFSMFNGTNCLPCPEGAYCAGGSSLVAKQGWWVPDNVTQDKYFNFEDCTEPNQHSTECENTRKAYGYEYVYKCGLAANSKCCVNGENSIPGFCVNNNLRCHENRMGIRCSQCAEGFARFGTNCVKCSRTETNIRGLLVLSWFTLYPLS